MDFMILLGIFTLVIGGCLLSDHQNEEFWDRIYKERNMINWRDLSKKRKG